MFLRHPFLIVPTCTEIIPMYTFTCTTTLLIWCNREMCTTDISWKWPKGRLPLYFFFLEKEELTSVMPSSMIYFIPNFFFFFHNQLWEKNGKRRVKNIFFSFPWHALMRSPFTTKNCEFFLVKSSSGKKNIKVKKAKLLYYLTHLLSFHLTPNFTVK